MGTFFLKNGIRKGKGLDLGAEPPCIKQFWLPPTGIVSSKRNEMWSNLRLTAPYKSLYFINSTLELLPLFVALQEPTMEANNWPLLTKKCSVLLLELEGGGGGIR